MKFNFFSDYVHISASVYVKVITISINLMGYVIFVWNRFNFRYKFDGNKTIIRCQREI